MGSESEQRQVWAMIYAAVAAGGYDGKTAATRADQGVEAFKRRWPDRYAEEMQDRPSA